MTFHPGILLVLSALTSQVISDCTEKEIKQIQDCRAGGEFMHIYILGEQGIAGLLLKNLTEANYNLHCQVLNDYEDCMRDVRDQCQLVIQTDSFFQGLLSYQRYVCSHSYQDYISAYRCKTAISKLESVQHCDANASNLNLHPGPDSGYCSDVSSWLRCYTAAVSEQCTGKQGTPTTDSAIYVMTSQSKLVEEMANAAKCELQEYMHYNTEENKNQSTTSRGWIHGIWISVVIVCVLIGVLAYLVYRKRPRERVPRQRLVNEIA